MSIKVTIGWTKNDRKNDDYVSFVDGYREGAEQYTLTFPVHVEQGVDPLVVAEAAFEASNLLGAFGDDARPGNDVGNQIAEAILASGYRGHEAGHFSLSVGDTVEVDGVRLACHNLGWKEV